MMKGWTIRCLTVVFCCLGAVPMASGASDDILRIGIRTDAPPFSYREVARDGRHTGKPAGYSVELCRQFAEVAGLRAVYVDVDTRTRFRNLGLPGDRGIDILCGATTVTLNILQDFDVSFYTFLTATTFMSSQGLEQILDDDEGKQIRVRYRSDTTSRPGEKRWQNDTRRQLSRLLGVKAGRLDFLSLSSHWGAVNGLKGAAAGKGGFDLYIGDRPILSWLVKDDPSTRPLGIYVSKDVLTVQPYALILPKCSNRLLVLNRFLAGMFLDQKFQRRWRERFGYDYDAGFAKLMRFQTLVPDGVKAEPRSSPCGRRNHAG